MGRKQLKGDGSSKKSHNNSRNTEKWNWTRNSLFRSWRIGMTITWITMPIMLSALGKMGIKGLQASGISCHSFIQELIHRFMTG